jgi:predicted Zn-dependent peptidase
VALSPDHASPTFSMAVVYRAGTRVEKPGQSGLAHLVEHVLFEGSANVARGEHNALVTGAGGGLSGTTVSDMSLFWMTLPANQLELALFLEADRMRGIENTPEGLKAARDALMEERARATSDPYSRARYRLTALSFDSFSNQRSNMGSVEEINRATNEDVARFYQTWYTPANAGLVVVGDFDPVKARERIRHYFEDIPARPAPRLPDTREPERKAEKREISTDAALQTTLVLISWRVPPATDADWFTVKRLAEALGANEAARLYTTLVKSAGIAGNVIVNLEDSAGPNLVTAMVILAPGKDPAHAERLVYEEIERIAREGLAKEELERLEIDALRRRAFSLVTTPVRAIAFGQSLVAYGSLDSVNLWEKAEHGVTSEDVQKAARRYFAASNRTVLVITPGGEKR